MTVRIAMWSGPRNISTALMRSFGARSDTAVSDEPFFGAYLRASAENQPMAAETMASMDCDFASVLKTLSGPAPGGSQVWYQKHMPHHMVGAVSIEDMRDHRHAFLIRAPERVAASYAAKNELRGPELLGYQKLRCYFDWAAEQASEPPPVVDADDVLVDPAAVLERLCAALGIDWAPAMLTWARGPHPEDGAWAPHWYERVNASTGFAPPPGPPPELSGQHAEVAAACRADYEALARYRL